MPAFSGSLDEIARSRETLPFTSGPMPMSASTFRTVFPLALITGTGMLAMDLYLPAVPALQAGLGVDIRLAQATVAVFLAGLAASQLLWGAALNRFGPRRCMQAGVGLLAAASFGCAFAPGIEALLALRLLQGVAAGAAAVIAPSLVRASLPDEDAVKGIATISMVESFVPAAGPVLGTLLLPFIDWRGLFVVVGAVALVLLPFVVHIAPRRLPGLDHRDAAGYRQLLANPRYLHLMASHALCVGALLTFVASAPQVMAQVLRLEPSAFATLQVIGVAGFMSMASQSGRISRRLGTARAVQLGSAMQLALSAALCIASLVATPGFAVVAVYWAGFCGALAVRGPATFSDALALPPALMGRASALLVLALLAVGALGTQIVAPWLEGASLAPLAAAMLLMLIASGALVWRYPGPADPLSARGASVART